MHLIVEPVAPRLFDSVSSITAAGGKIEIGAIDGNQMQTFVGLGERDFLVE